MSKVSLFSALSFFLPNRLSRFWQPLGLALVGLLTFQAAIAEPDPAAIPTAMSSQNLSYQAQIGALVAGNLDFSLQRDEHRYGLLGRFITSKTLSAYYTWTGKFVANGRWQDGRPQTLTYLVQSESKDEDYKVVVMSEDETQRLKGRDGEFEVLPKPRGNDLISSLMFTPQCYRGDYVHDGEDEYFITLVKTRSAKLSKRRGFYSGPVTRCDYQVTTRRDKKRRVSVSMAEVDGLWVAAEVRIRLTLFPDPIFRLRV